MIDHLKKYQYLIETLAPQANEPFLNDLIEEKTPDCSEEIRFLLIMEIKRLALPCAETIDLRLLVDDDCAEIIIDNVELYLSEEGKELFEYLMAFYKKYTVGVKEGVINYFTQQREIALGKTKKNKNELDAVPYAHTYISPSETLLEYPSRQEERFILKQEIRIFLSSTIAIVAHCLDISQRGLRLRLNDETELTLIKGYRPVQVVFTEFDRLSKLHTTPIAYKVVRISKGLQQAEIHLERDWDEGPKRFNDYYENLQNSLKKQRKVDLSNTQRSVETRVYEQAFANTCQGVSLFINTKSVSAPRVEYACINDNNLEIFDYWQDEKNKQIIGYMFSKERLKDILLKSDSDESLIIYSFNHLSAGKLYFYSASSTELENSPELKDVFLSYASRKLSWRVFKLAANQIDYSHSILPTSLPNRTLRGTSQVGRGLTPRLISALENLSHMVTLTDITHAIGQQCYQQRNLENNRIKLLSVFGHARNRSAQQIELLKYEVLDKRKERRYKLRTEVIVEYNNQSTTGVTEDISVKGLRIELEQPLRKSAKKTAAIGFTSLQTRTKDYDLTRLPYEVMRISEDGYILHLQTKQDEKAQRAEKFFDTLIQKNRDKLKVLTNEESNPGLRQALRILQAKYSPQICVYTRQQKDLHIPIKTSVRSLASTTIMPFMHRMPRGYLNLNSMFSGTVKAKQIISTGINQARKSGFSVTHEAFIRFDETNIDAIEAVHCKWEQELDTHVERYQFIKKSMEHGRFFALRITFIEPTKPQPTLYDDEYKYLVKHAKRDAQTLEQLAWNFSGQIFITDITQEVLYRYHLVQY